METLISSEFDLKTRLAVIEFLLTLRVELLGSISDINHAIEWMRLGGDDGEEKEENWTNEDRADYWRGTV